MAFDDLSDAELDAITYTVLGEAAGEGRRGMAAVANVIKNRAESGRYSSNPASVALQQNHRGIHQFSTWNTKANEGNNPTGRYKKDSKLFREARDIVERVLAGEIADETGGATHFVTKSLHDTKKPKWWESEAPAGNIQIGNHVFGARSSDGGVPRPVNATNIAATRAAADTPLPMPAPLSAPGAAIAFAPGMNGAIAGTPAARAAAALGGGDLTARAVRTVPVDPLTGRPVPMAAIAGVRAATPARQRAGAPLSPANQNLAQARAEQAAAKATTTAKPRQQDGSIERNVSTTIVRADGTVVQMPRAGDAQMPRDYRPEILSSQSKAAGGIGTETQSKATVEAASGFRLPKTASPEAPKTAAQTLRDIKDREESRVVSATKKPALTPVTYTTTIKVRNPAFNSTVALGKATGTAGASASASGTAKLGPTAAEKGLSAVAPGAINAEPEFIDKVITVTKMLPARASVIVPIKPISAVPSPLTRPQALAREFTSAGYTYIDGKNVGYSPAEQARRAARGKSIAEANRRNPNPTFNVAGDNNAFQPRSVQESVRWQTGY